MRYRSVSFLIFLLLVFSNFVQAETLMIAGGEQSNPIVKVARFIMDDIYREMGHQAKFKHMPLLRSLTEANNGKFDGELARISGLEKKFPNLIQIPVAIYKIEGVVFAKNKTFPVKGWESLKPYRIGVLRGTQFAEKGTENMDRELRNSLESLFKMLDAKRLDVVVEAKLNGIIKIKQLKLCDSIEILNPPLVSMELFHYVHKKNRDMVPKLTGLLTRMEQDGSLDELILKSEQNVIKAMTEKTDFQD